MCECCVGEHSFFDWNGGKEMCAACCLRILIFYISFLSPYPAALPNKRKKSFVQVF